MQNLEQILKNIDVVSVQGSTEIRVGNICFDSRKAVANDIYIAIRGNNTDGHNYIPDVIERGVKAIVCEVFPADKRNDCCYIKVEDSQKALALMASNFYNNPSQSIKLIGVTGTNGKTTIATLLYHLFTDLGYKCGLISTINTYIAEKEGVATHTTPDSLQINSLLSEMVDVGCEYAFMEVSSHSTVQKRIDGLSFCGGIFTNITHDHLDYHKDFKSYIDAKRAFFDKLPTTAFALINIDDKNGKIMVQNTKAGIHTYGIKSQADFKAKILESHFTGNLLQIGNKELWTRLPGIFNTYNILAIYGTAILLGADDEQVLKSLSRQESVSGRFQIIRSPKGLTSIIDYAHTPDAVENVLRTIRDIRKSGQRIITIIGAGGNRDKTKRPVMARIAAELSDKVILTSDNPRNEDPVEILNEMKEGLNTELMERVISITDRKEAIKAACAFAEKSDIILVAGKGHEKYQEIQGKRYPFDDSELVKKCLENK